MTRKVSSASKDNVFPARLPVHRPAKHAPPVPPAIPAPRPAVCCSSCIHAVQGRFQRSDGKPTPRVPDTLLVLCECNHWHSVVRFSTLYTKATTFRQRAASCPDFVLGALCQNNP